MPKQFRYSADAKAKIVEAVKSARKAGKKAAEVFEAAKDAGYRGGEGALKNMIYTDKAFAGVSKRRRRGRKPARPAEAAVSSNGAAKRGRPRKTASPATGDLGDIQQAINGVVRQRVSGLIAQIRAALDEAERMQ